MLILPDQIRAARALLKWGQDELSKRSGVSVPAIANIENEKQQPTVGTQQKMYDVLVDAGIEFIDGGVRRAQNLISIYEGNDCYLRLLDDAFLTLSKTKGEFLLSGADERRSSDDVTEKTRAMRRSGITMRFLVKNGDTHLMGALDEYRWMDEGLFAGGDVKVIYDANVAYLMTWRGTPRVVIIKDANIAEENRRLFNWVWDNARTPTHSTSPVLYEGKRK